MKTRNNILLPRAQKPLTILGENIRLARLRRRYSMEQVAERADISRPTLHSIERGNSNVTIGAYVKVLAVLGLEQDIAAVAKDDTLGRKIQDAGLIIKERAPKINIKTKSNTDMHETVTNKQQEDGGHK
ncbi:MAG: helix-turn-helix domain-containing protein [Bacteroidales bacterium]